VSSPDIIEAILLVMLLAVPVNFWLSKEAELARSRDVAFGAHQATG
jgi:hypothetical protein